MIVIKAFNFTQSSTLNPNLTESYILNINGYYVSFFFIQFKFSHYIYDLGYLSFFRKYYAEEMRFLYENTVSILLSTGNLFFVIF